MKPPANGLAILVWSCDLEQPERAATPFVLAQAAAALECEVEMLFTARSVAWLLQENRELPLGFGPQRLAVGRYLEQTSALGVRILACGQALHALGRDAAALAPQCAGVGGVVAYLERAMAPGWRSMVF